MTQAEPLQAAATVRRRVRELRKAHDWTAERLAEEMAKAGFGWTRQTVTNMETGRRSLGIDELVGLAAVLDVALIHLLVPPYPSPLWGGDGDSRSPDDPNEPNDNAPYQVTPELMVPCWRARQFVRGWRPLPGQDATQFFLQQPPQERGRGEGDYGAPD
jgi:transcriptional regulator with XRE-family HTH domain